MLINEVTTKTGLTRKAVYFYVEQGFVAPTVLEANGYRDYSEADVERLTLIGRLRSLDFTIAEIRSLLETGGRIDMPLHRVIERKEAELRAVLSSVYRLRRLIDAMPPNTCLEGFSELLSQTDTHEGTSFELTAEFDSSARKAGLLLWEAALDVEREDVVKKLWPKLVDEMRKARPLMDSYEAYYSKFDDAQLEKDYWGRRNRVAELAALSPERRHLFVEELIEEIKLLADSKALQDAWLEIYDTVTMPLLKMSHPLNELVCDYNPVFRGYVSTLSAIKPCIKHFFESDEGKELAKKLKAGAVSDINVLDVFSMLDYYCHSLFTVILPDEMKKLKKRL